MIRDLGEMRTFKKSEAQLVKNIQEGDSIAQVIYKAALRQLRSAHQRYIQGDTSVQLALAGLEGQRSDLIYLDETTTLTPRLRATQLEAPPFDYADLNFESPEEKKDS